MPRYWGVGGVCDIIFLNRGGTLSSPYALSMHNQVGADMWNPTVNVCLCLEETFNGTCSLNTIHICHVAYEIFVLYFIWVQISASCFISSTSQVEKKKNKKTSLYNDMRAVEMASYIPWTRKIKVKWGPSLSTHYTKYNIQEACSVDKSLFLP